MNLDAELERLYASPLAAVPPFKPRHFADDLAAHFQTGYVWSSPTAFIMARLVSSKWTWDALSDLTRAASGEEADAWCVWVAVGDLREFFRVCPHEAKFACFARRGFPRLWPFEKLKRLSYGIHDAKSSGSSARSSARALAGA